MFGSIIQQANNHKGNHSSDTSLMGETSKHSPRILTQITATICSSNQKQSHNSSPIFLTNKSLPSLWKIGTQTINNKGRNLKVKPAAIGNNHNNKDTKIYVENLFKSKSKNHGTQWSTKTLPLWIKCPTKDDTRKQQYKAQQDSQKKLQASQIHKRKERKVITKKTEVQPQKQGSDRCLLLTIRPSEFDHSRSEWSPRSLLPTVQIWGWSDHKWPSDRRLDRDCAVRNFLRFSLFNSSLCCCCFCLSRTTLLRNWRVQICH